MASYVICRFFRNSPPQTLHDFLHFFNINFGLSKHSPLSAQAEHLPTTFASSSQVSMVKIFLLCEQDQSKILLSKRNRKISVRIYLLDEIIVDHLPFWSFVYCRSLDSLIIFTCKPSVGWSSLPMTKGKKEMLQININVTIDNSDRNSAQMTFSMNINCLNKFHLLVFNLKM